MATQRIECPGCAMDVMEVGFTTIAESRATFMGWMGGPVQVASEQRPAHRVVCAQCGAELAAKPVELMRAA